MMYSHPAPLSGLFFHVQGRSFLTLNRQINIPFAVASIRWIPYCSLVLLGLIGVLPFINRHHSHPLVSFYSEWLAIFLGMAAGLALLTPQFWLNLVIPGTAIYIFSLAVIFTIQGIALPGPYAAQWLIPTLYLGWAIMLMVLAVWLREYLGKEKIVETLAWFLAVGGLLSAFTGLVQYIGFGGWLGQYVAFKQGATIYGNVAQPNHFANHILLATTGLCYLYSRNRLSSVLAISLLTFFALIVSLSASRAVFLYAISLCALSAAGYLKTRDTVNSRLCFLAIFFLAAYIGAQHLLEQIHPWLMELVKDWSLNSDPLAYNTALEKFSKTPLGLEVRTSEWHKAWLMFLDAPVFGVGIGNYAWHSFSYQTLPEFSGIEKPQLFSHSHNLFAQVIAETGLAGLIILLLLLVGWVKQFYRHWTQPDWLIAAVLLVIFIHSNLEFPLWYSYFLGISALMLGLGDSRSFDLKIAPRPGQIGSGFVLLLGFAILVYTLLGFQNLVRISLPYSLLTPKEKKDAALTVANNPLLTPYAELSLLAMTPTTKDGIRENIAITTRAFRRNPDPYKVYKQTTFLALNKQTAEANELLHRAAQAYPDNLSLYLKQLQRGRREPELIPVIEEATRLQQATESKKLKP